MLRDGKKTVGSGKDADAIGIDALTVLAEDHLTRFVALSGLTVGQQREEATRPALFVGLLDSILAHEATQMSVASVDGLDPAEVDPARHELAER